MLSNLSTYFRLTQTRNTGFLPLPAPRENRTRANGSNNFRRHRLYTDHTVYEKTRNLRTNACLSMGNTFSYLVGPPSRLGGRPPFEPSLSKGVFPLRIATNGPNGIISLTQTFIRMFLEYKTNKTRIGEQSYILCDPGWYVQRT